MDSAQVDEATLAKEIQDAMAALQNARQATIRPVDSRDAAEARRDVEEATVRLARANAAFLATVGRPYQQVPAISPGGPGESSKKKGKISRGGKANTGGKKRRRWPPKG